MSKTFHFTFTVKDDEGVTYTDSNAYTTDNPNVSPLRVTDWMGEQVEETYGGELVEITLTRVEVE